LATLQTSITAPKFLKFVLFGDASAVAWQAGTKHVRHEHDVVLDTDRTLDDRLVTEVACRAQEFGVSVAHLIAT
jgi:hypothetical protein